MRNIVAKLPSEAVPEVKSYIDAVYRAPTYEAGQTLATEVLEK
jgi:hypothetical protein